MTVLASDAYASWYSTVEPDDRVVAVTVIAAFQQKGPT